MLSNSNNDSCKTCKTNGRQQTRIIGCSIKSLQLFFRNLLQFIGKRSRRPMQSHTLLSRRGLRHVIRGAGKLYCSLSPFLPFSPLYCPVLITHSECPSFLSAFFSYWVDIRTMDETRNQLHLQRLFFPPSGKLSLIQNFTQYIRIWRGLDVTGPDMAGCTVIVK